MSFISERISLGVDTSPEGQRCDLTDIPYLTKQATSEATFDETLNVQDNHIIANKS